MNFAQLLQAYVTPTIGLDKSFRHIAPPAKHLASVRLDPELLYARVSPTFVGFVLSFDDSAKTEKHEGFDSCSWILCKLTEWTILIDASAYLSAMTISLAEYTGMNNGAKAALELKVPDLIIVGRIQARNPAIHGCDRMQERLVTGDVSASKGISRPV